MESHRTWRIWWTLSPHCTKVALLKTDYEQYDSEPTVCMRSVFLWNNAFISGARSNLNNFLILLVITINVVTIYPKIWHCVVKLILTLHQADSLDAAHCKLLKQNPNSHIGRLHIFETYLQGLITHIRKMRMDTTKKGEKHPKLMGFLSF